MTIHVECRTCGSSFTAPDSAEGRTFPCKKCSTSLHVTAFPNSQPGNALTYSVEPPPPSTRIVQYRAEESPPMRRIDEVVRLSPGRQVADYTDCAFCGEEILTKAKKCKHCGEVLDVALRAAEEAKSEARRDTGRGRDRGSSVNIDQRIFVQGHSAGFNHGMHLVLDLLTLGAWFPIHMICWACHS